MTFWNEPGGSSHPSWIRALGVPLAAFGLWLSIAAPARAANTVLVPVPGPKSKPADPDPRWDTSSTLRPDSILGDSTSYNGAADPHDGNTLQFYALDIENGYLFVATGQGMEIFSLSQPGTRLSYIYGWASNSAFPIWLFSDKDWFIKQIDAPEGNNNVVALAMEEQGLAIVNTTVKTNPVVAYQRDVLVFRVYAFTANGTNYAYATGASGEVYLFNLDAAAHMTRCSEEPPATGCTGVYMGSVAAFGTGATSLAGTGTFVATGSPSRTSGGISIWKAASPTAPVKLLSIPGATASVALWKLGASYYAAQLDLTGQQLSIYNVSCIATGSCAAVSPVWSGTVTSTRSMQFVTASVDGGKAYLYLGAEDLGLGTCVPQREFLYDVSQPSAPVELTPHVNHDAAGGYWGWYYGNCPTGFNLVGPRIGKVSGGRLYRAAISALDTHKIFASGPPSASFTWSPAVVYPGTPVQFTDASGGQPTGWSWVFDAGANPSTAAPPTSTQQNPAVTYSAPGTKTVTLIASNAQGASPPASQPLTVLDPKPAVVSIAVSPPSPTVCQPVTFTANGVTGKPPLTYTWKISGPAQATGTVNPFTWTTGAGTPAGAYTAQVTVSNGTTDATKSVPFTLGGLTLPANGFPIPDPGPPPADTVQFHLNVPGATSWCWDFDDDNNPATVVRTCSTDPVAGPNPLHTYSTANPASPRKVTVQVSNCVNTAGVTSAPLNVTITNVPKPVKAQFAFNVLCAGGLCFVEGGTAVVFIDQSTGANFWDYDWNGDGTWDEVGNTAPKPSHVYAAGTYTPKLRVRSNTGASDIFTSPNKLVVSPGAGIAISGPDSGTTSVALSFSGSGTGTCSPSANGWTWQAGDGVVNGGSAGSVAITWPSTGDKTVTATNSACPTVQAGSKPVKITDLPLVAAFQTSATCVNEFGLNTCTAAAGDVVTFTDQSTGNPASWSWSFGDGGTASGPSVSHTFSQPNTTPTVTLTIGRGAATASAVRPFNIVPNTAAGKSVLLPWVARSQDVPVQTTDLYLLNPVATPMSVTLTFRRRGAPEATPPSVSRTIQPGATLYAADALNGLFNLQTASGFLTVTVDQGDAAPVVTAYNALPQSGGGAYGQAFSAVSLSGAASAGPQVQELAGLGNNSTLIASFGVSNPGQNAQSYTVQLFDNLGRTIGTAQNFSVPAFGQRQFLPSEIRNLFGVTTQEDYRAEVWSTGGQLFPFSANLRFGSSDPSLVGAVSTAAQKATQRVYLIGALSQPGAGGSTWQSDILLANTSTDTVTTNVTYTGTGATAQPTAPAQFTVPPGGSLRLADVIGKQWGLRNTAGVLTLDSQAPGGVFPIVTGTSYTGPAGKRFGQLMPAMAESQAAAAGASQYLAGLRQDAKSRTFLWVFNPGTVPCVYDLVYLALDGHELGRIPGVTMGPGTVRQLGPPQHKLPAAGVADGFTVQVQVKSGKVLAAAQVVDSATNDPAYVQGATR